MSITVKIEGPMSGVEALKALIEGHAIRHRMWTPINRLQRVWDEFLEEHVVIARGTEMFMHDARTGEAHWILERLCDPGECWEVWINNLEDEYQAWLKEQREA